MKTSYVNFIEAIYKKAENDPVNLELTENMVKRIFVNVQEAIKAKERAANKTNKVSKAKEMKKHDECISLIGDIADRIAHIASGFGISVPHLVCADPEKFAYLLIKEYAEYKGLYKSNYVIAFEYGMKFHLNTHMGATNKTMCRAEKVCRFLNEEIKKGIVDKHIFDDVLKRKYIGTRQVKARKYINRINYASEVIETTGFIMAVDEKNNTRPVPLTHYDVDGKEYILTGDVQRRVRPDEHIIGKIDCINANRKKDTETVVNAREKSIFKTYGYYISGEDDERTDALLRAFEDGMTKSAIIHYLFLLRNMAKSPKSKTNKYYKGILKDIEYAYTLDRTTKEVSEIADIEILHSKKLAQ